MLSEIVFRDPGRGHANVSRLLTDLSPSLSTRVSSLLSASADPDAAAHYLQRLRQEQAPAFERLTASAAALQLLATVFSQSRFLSEEVLQHPEWIEELAESSELHRTFTTADFRYALEQRLERDEGAVPLALSLAQFRRRQILRILLRDVLRLCTLGETTEELSYLADAALDVTYRYIRRSFQERYGTPHWKNADGVCEECRFTVISLGKLGGTELNYSSDIDLMFLFTASGETDGPERISNKEFFKKIANAYTHLLSTYTAAGMCYRVDLRLRPDGRLGEVCLSLDGAKRYYEQRARDWELQMLIKARVSAGDEATGRALLEFVEPRTYSTTLDFSAVEAMSETRERINEKLATKRRGPEQFDVKLAPGGIRDIEFLVQCLQRLHGGREPWVRHGGTLLALFRLRDKGLLSESEYGQLASAYQFLRHVEHRLQWHDDRQTHTLPASEDELTLLARRLPAELLGDTATAGALMAKLREHVQHVQVIYERVIHVQQPLFDAASAPASLVAPEEILMPEPASNVVRHLDHKAPELASVLSNRGLRRGSKAFEQLLEQLESIPNLLEQLNTDAVLAGYVIDIFEHSPYLAEQFVRTPELIGQLLRLRHDIPSDIPYAELADAVEDAGELRRLFRQEMIRIQSESLCLAYPIFRTLACTSDLAEAAVAAAYRMAIGHVYGAHPPQRPHYNAWNQMMVIALGRLGMREFDLASDADLLFVVPDQDQSELQFWTRVAERMIALLSAYTKEGMIFSVDTRLRPNGRKGALVQTVSGCKRYFETQAEAWEGIAYMKARAIAGDVHRATAFLNELQEVDWRRYGQGGRSRRELRAMRMRLEKEQGQGLALKTGYGGYYDIDFALMYLRLRGAGMFFKVLNTPERIEVIEKMGHLDREDAEFLEEAATFYRAVDHGLRLHTGHAEGSLPASSVALDALTEMVRRWTKISPEEPLAATLARIQQRTRGFFDRLFG